MALKKGNVYLQVSMKKEQRDWLYSFCEKHNITPSKYIRWLLSKKAEEMIKLLRIDKSSYSPEELEEIIHANWIDD